MKKLTALLLALTLLLAPACGGENKDQAEPDQPAVQDPAPPAEPAPPEDPNPTRNRSRNRNPNPSPSPMKFWTPPSCPRAGAGTAWPTRPGTAL